MDKENFYKYLDNTGAEYTVDNNPSEEKIKEIKARETAYQIMYKEIGKRLQENLKIEEFQNKSFLPKYATET